MHDEKTSKASPKASFAHRSNVPGVRYDHAWAATLPHEEPGSTSSTRRVTSRTFSIIRPPLGYDEAKRQGEAARLEADISARGGSCPHDVGGVPCPEQSEPTCAQLQSKRARTTADSLDEPRPVTEHRKKRTKSTMLNPDHLQSTVNGVHWSSIKRAWVSNWIDIDTGTHCAESHHTWAHPKSTFHQRSCQKYCTGPSHLGANSQ
jgi:hypothetical protein